MELNLCIVQSYFGPLLAKQKKKKKFCIYCQKIEKEFIVPGQADEKKKRLFDSRKNEKVLEISLLHKSSERL